MQNRLQIPIEHENLSYAWAEAFLSVCDTAHPGPMMVSVIGFENGFPIEDAEIRTRLDEALPPKFSPRTTASLIFPLTFWELMHRPRLKKLSGLYLEKLLPRLKRRNSINAGGTYFGRMVSFGVDEINQLEFIKGLWTFWTEKERPKRPRRAALQVLCFDPSKDNSRAARKAFPCLHQVSFSYDGDQLSVTAYYPTQFLFERAYGNYLGLCYRFYASIHQRITLGRRERHSLVCIKSAFLMMEISCLLPHTTPRSFSLKGHTVTIWDFAILGTLWQENSI